jgi:hypothetical protein
MSDKNAPDTRSLANQRQAEASRICQDCYEGPLKIRAEGETYLPRFPMEQRDEHGDPYTDRLESSVFYDVFSRTVDGLTGLVFREPIKISAALPREIKALLENVDGLGTHIDVFAASRHQDGETDGHFVIFVDSAEPSESERVRADQKDRLPYFVGIKKQDVLAADYDRVDGQLKLVHFRYLTCTTVKDGAYGQKEVPQVREYNLVRTETGLQVEFIIHTKGDDDKWTAGAPGYMEIDEIPAVAGYHGRRVGPFESRPGLLPLALENIKHYQLVSDNDNILHVCSVPQFAVIGARPLGLNEKPVISPKVGWHLPADGKLQYAEPSGNGLEAAEKRIQKSEQRMAILGLSMLMSESRAAETAAAKTIDKAESDAALTLHARATNDALEECLRLAAKWLDVDLPAKTSERWLSINTEFTDATLNPQVMDAYTNAVFKAGLPKRVYVEAMKQGKRIPATFNSEELVEEMEDNEAAKEEARRLDEVEKVLNEKPAAAA